MSFMTINDKQIEFEGKESILKLARENGIEIPTLCFLEDCANIGQCGVCLVEIEGQERLARACAMKAKEGMVVKTNTQRVTDETKAAVTVILDKHEFKCGPCSRKENCEFLKLVIKTKARATKPFKVENKSDYVDDRSRAITFDRSKCTVCGRCVAACRNYTKTNSIKFHKVENERRVGADGLKCFDDTNCLLCGQCVIACPVDALKEKSHIERVNDAINNPDKHVVVAMAPAVRASMGELFKMEFGTDVTGKLYTVLRELGFDKIFDINFGADLTIMEEARELLDRVKENKNLPMFTSCCPSWVRQVEKFYPELKKNLSTTKSPQQIFGVTSKTYYPKQEGLNAEDVFTVTIMPCTSKKFEADREAFEFEGRRDIDAVITTRELARMIKDKKIKFSDLEDGTSDSLMSEYSGASVIFGSSGGVMESALRTAKDFIEGDTEIVTEFTQVRGYEGVKESIVKIGDMDLKVAVINGAANLSEFIKAGKLEEGYHFIEVMACPGGCINGGGQPHLTALDRAKIDIKSARGKVLYNQDLSLLKRKAHQNPEIIKLYAQFMGKLGEYKAHQLLHYSYDRESKH
ncbi:ferredoxin hydrogenase [uncultured Clostridium sp.]|uniref:ferredoxin hydrogenase n=1 Tax=uncultured Clostridium sp. TaxID=59620 RepID=UPI00260BED7B|nr:ferredoxin hydrogenase [uncultured Clostridium sp.]